MFSQVRMHVFSNLRRHTRHFENLISPKRKLGFLINSNINSEKFCLEKNAKGRPHFILPVDKTPISLIWYSVPGKGGCQSKGEVEGGTTFPRKIMKNPAEKQEMDCPTHSVVCPKPPRPDQPCGCTKDNVYKLRKLGECPGPCPRPGKPKCPE